MSANSDKNIGRPGSGASCELEIWCVDLARSAAALRQAETRTPRLSGDDRVYAAGFKDAEVAAERTLTRIALRLLIERAIGETWRAAPIQRRPHGKPYIHGAPVAFSVSHIDGLALIGIAAQGAIGVDVERTREVHMRAPRRSRIEAAAAALNPTALLPEGDDGRFLQAWVRLEALGKADGGGIGRLLTRLDIAGRDADPETADWPERAAEAMASASVSVLSDLDLGKGLFAAVAAGPSREPPQVRWLPFKPEELEGFAR